MNLYMTNQFNPEFQFMSGLLNPTVEAPSLSSFSRLQSNAADVLKQLYRFTGNYNYMPLRIVITKTPFYSMFMKYIKPKRNLQSNLTSRSLEWRRLLKHFNLSCQTSGEKILEDQHIEFKMLSEPVTTFKTDTNGRSISMATTVNLVKSIQGIHCSRVIKVLFDSEGSASVISRKVSPIGIQIIMI